MPEVAPSVEGRLVESVCALAMAGGLEDRVAETRACSWDFQFTTSRPWC
jgi:hypothetical protein